MYKAKIGDMEFYIQPDMMKKYSDMGYEIISENGDIVKDIPNEMKKNENSNIIFYGDRI